MASFSFSMNDGSGFFKAPRQSSIFRGGVEFTITKAVTGVWTDANGKVINKDGANSIRFETSLSSNQDDLLNINRLIGKRRVVYSDAGRARQLFDCEFHEELVKFLEQKIGRADDSRFYKGTAKEIGDRLVAEFFKGKTVMVEEVPDVYFKTIKDGVEKLELPYEPLVVFKFKS